VALMLVVPFVCVFIKIQKDPPANVENDKTTSCG